MAGDSEIFRCAQAEHVFPFHAMGCPCELRFCGDSLKVAEAAEKCIQEARRFEGKYSRFLETSVTTQINQSAGLHPVAIDRETWSILRYAGVCYEQSGGLFDITSGVLRQVWHRQLTGLPGKSEIDACVELIGCRV